YLQWMGIKKKEKRLRFLKNYWLQALEDVPNIVINTPLEDSRSCGIGNVGVKNIKPATLAKRLYDEFKIFTVAIDYANVQGCRITPNVFTTRKELDTFIQAMKSIALA
ncbi:MAG: aminotransferase, partial [Flavobacteriaceae bacterium]|nr:aminotransferase [Flavobacteriaceae bacterium]